jgi:hypothetical protein
MSDQEREHLRAIFPKATDDQLLEMWDRLNQYAELAWEIFQERRQSPSSASPVQPSKPAAAATLATDPRTFPATAAGKRPDLHSVRRPASPPRTCSSQKPQFLSLTSPCPGSSPCDHPSRPILETNHLQSRGSLADNLNSYSPCPVGTELN